MLEFQQFYEFMSNEVVQYAFQAVVVFGSVIASSVTTLKKQKKANEAAKAVLESSNLINEELSAKVKNSNDLVDMLGQKVETNNLDTLKLREELIQSHKQLTEQLKKDHEQQMKLIKEEHEAKMAQLNSVMATLETLSKLPEAFAQSVSLNSESVKNGTARKVNDILGFNKDNLQTNATTPNTKANNLFKGIQLNLNNKKQEEEKK